MTPSNTVAALRAHENARLPAEAYDGGMRPAAARARDADPQVTARSRDGRDTE